MPPIRWPSPAQYPGGPLENAPPYPDLVARQFHIFVRHDEGTVGVAGTFANVGNSSINRPFHIAIGVTIDWPPQGAGGPVRSQQQIFEIEPPVTSGVIMETPPSNAPLIYNDEEGAVYWLDMIVDVNNEIIEYGGARNSLTNQKWIVFSPAGIQKAKGGSALIGDIAAELKEAKKEDN
jgi:hypothetical protein